MHDGLLVAANDASGLCTPPKGVDGKPRSLLVPRGAFCSTPHNSAGILAGGSSATPHGSRQDVVVSDEQLLDMLDDVSLPGKPPMLGLWLAVLAAE